MNRANQEKLAHDVNMTLIQIRAAEVSYFNDFFGNFGIQAGILISLVLANVAGIAGSNVSGMEDGMSGMDLRAGGIGSPVFAYLFFYGSVVSFVLGTHILICTLLCSVFGQGLALRGPLGSMVSAVEGMVEEQRSIVNFFGIMMLSFAISIVGMFGCLLDQTNAIMIGIILVVGMYFWYSYALRIYNRFYYPGFYEINYDTNRESDLNESSKLESNGDSFNVGSKLPIIRPKRGSTWKMIKNPFFRNKSKKKQDHMDGDSGSEVSDAEDSIVMSKMHHDGSLSSMTDYHDPTIPVTKEGHLTVLLTRRFGDEWKRRYFVFKGTALFYYKSKFAYSTDPRRPRNNRPIKLGDYELHSDVDNGNYLIELRPISADDNRKSWKFKCDTSNEHKRWLDSFKEVFQLVGQSEK